MDKFRDQAKRFGAECHFKHVTKVDLSDRPFKAWVADETYTSDTIIIATGATARLLGLESETRLMGHGVSACATCDGFFFKDKKVLVIGGGDSAMEEANFLTKFAAEVQIVHRRDALRASKIMQDRIMNNPRITIQWNTVLEDIEGNEVDGVSGVSLRDTRTDEVRQDPCDGVFLAIGHVPNTELFDAVLDLDDQKYIRTVDASSRTSIAGVFACGDVQDHVYRQAITAAGTGCMAAMDAEKYLESLAA
jgi:thioredoxin reductase (NADPH)